MIYFTSDYHFCHNKDFLYEPRGFDSIEEMNECIIKNHNTIIKPEDDVYFLGDFMLCDDQHGLECIEKLNGKIHVILGNHDTDNRIKLYQTCDNIVEITVATRLRYKKFHFLLTHYPSFTGNLQKESLRQMTLNLYGHTHQKTNFFDDYFFMYHVGVDSHNCYPVSIEDIIKEMKEKKEHYEDDSK